MTDEPKRIPTNDPCENALLCAQQIAARSLRRCAIMRVEPDTQLAHLVWWLEKAGFPVSDVGADEEPPEATP